MGMAVVTAYVVNTSRVYTIRFVQTAIPKFGWALVFLRPLHSSWGIGGGGSVLGAERHIVSSNGISPLAVPICTRGFFYTHVCLQTGSTKLSDPMGLHTMQNGYRSSLNNSYLEVQT